MLVREWERKMEDPVKEADKVFSRRRVREELSVRIFRLCEHTMRRPAVERPFQYLELQRGHIP